MSTPRLASTTLPGGDGLPIPVDVRTGARPGERRPAVVICHGFKGFKDWGFFPRLGDRLALAGFTAVSFNFCGSGVFAGEDYDQLERFARQRPTRDLADIGTVISYAIDVLGAPWVGLLGHSRGGGLATLRAGSDERVRALVTWAAIHDFLPYTPEEIARWKREGTAEVVNSRTGQVLTIHRDALEDIEANRGGALDVLAAAGRIRAPWLLAHGTADPTVPVQVAALLAAATVSERTELLLLDGADHTFGIRHPWAGSNPVYDEVLERTVGWFAGALG